MCMTLHVTVVNYTKYSHVIEFTIDVTEWIIEFFLVHRNYRIIVSKIEYSMHLSL